MFCPYCASSCTLSKVGDFDRYVCDSCGHIQYSNPTPCVSVLVVDENERFLIGKRAGDVSYPFLWCLPCGHIEYEESFIEAAIRETKEETGIDVKPIKIINVVSNQLAKHIHSLVIVILAVPLNVAITAGDDITDVRWQSFDDELPEMAFEADRHIINKYVETEGRFGINLNDTTVSFIQDVNTNNCKYGNELGCLTGVQG